MRSLTVGGYAIAQSKRTSNQFAKGLALLWHEKDVRCLRRAAPTLVLRETSPEEAQGVNNVLLRPLLWGSL